MFEILNSKDLKIEEARELIDKNYPYNLTYRGKPFFDQYMKAVGIISDRWGFNNDEDYINRYNYYPADNDRYKNEKKIKSVEDIYNNDWRSDWMKQFNKQAYDLMPDYKEIVRDSGIGCQESYLGYIPIYDTFIMGFDVWNGVMQDEQYNIIPFKMKYTKPYSDQSKEDFQVLISCLDEREGFSDSPFLRHFMVDEDADREGDIFEEMCSSAESLYGFINQGLNKPNWKPVYDGRYHSSEDYANYIREKKQLPFIGVYSNAFSKVSEYDMFKDCPILIHIRLD